MIIKNSLTILASLLFTSTAVSSTLDPVGGFSEEKPTKIWNSDYTIWIDGFSDPPLISYYHADITRLARSQYGRPVHDYPFIFAIYPDGTAFYSLNPVVGGPPYQMTILSSSELADIQADVKTVRTTPNNAEEYITKEYDYVHTIRVVLPEGPYRLISSHLLVESLTDKVATHDGYLESASVSCFDEIDDQEPLHFVEYRQTWHRLVSIQEFLLTLQSSQAPSLDTDTVAVSNGQYVFENLVAERQNREAMEQTGDISSIQEIQALYSANLDIEPFSSTCDITLPNP